MIDALEICNAAHNKAFIKGALCSALSSILMSILVNESGIRESFECFIKNVIIREVVVSRIAKAVVTDPAVFAPIAQFVVESVKLEAAM